MKYERTVNGELMKFFKYITLLFLIFLQSCTPFAPDPDNPVPRDFPSKYEMYSEAGLDSPGRWWEGFQSDDLNGYVSLALGDNFTIREAWARLNQARAAAAKAGAALYPQVNIEAGATHSETRTDNNKRVIETNVDDYSLGLAASYEIDLWGRIRSLKTSENYKVQAGRADLDSAAMTVASEVVNTWIDLLSTREQIHLLERQAGTNAQILELLEIRFQNALANALDVLQQREVVARVKAQMPPLKAKEQTLRHALSLLQGRPPGAPIEISESDLPGLTPLPEPGLPADLLAMRPDVRAAGLRLKSSDWEVSAARADRLPTLSLTGRFEYSGDQLNLIFNNWLLNLAANLTGPIFDAGRRKAEVERTRAVVDERLANYEKTVLTAVREVEDALVNERRQLEHIEALKRQLEAARMAYDEAQSRYAKGEDNFINMLAGLTSVQDLERDLVTQRAALLKYRVSLYRALGGNWTGRLTPEGLADEVPAKKKSSTDQDKV